MKLVFNEIKGKRVVLNIAKNSSAEDVKKILMREHQFCDGTYVFIYNGKILARENSFADLKENSLVIVHIKDKLKQGEKRYTAEDFWENPVEAMEWAQLCAANNAMTTVLLDYGGILNNQSIPETDILILSGANVDIRPQTIPDYDAGIQELSISQRNDFNRVLNTSHSDRNVALQTFTACNCDPDLTIACLMSM